MFMLQYRGLGHAGGYQILATKVSGQWIDPLDVPTRCM